MATQQLNEYYEFLKSAGGEFTARPYYESESDSLIFYARDDQVLHQLSLRLMFLRGDFEVA